MRQRRLLGVAIIAAATVTWIAPASSGGAQSDPGPSPATVTVTPDHDLVDNQTVQVDGAGFPPGESLQLMQCRPGSVSLTDVMANCELKTSFAADAAGTFSAFHTVEREILPVAASTPIDCGAAPGACTIAVLVGFTISSTVVEAPISFAGVATPAPTVSVAPAAGLDEGDVVAVTGNGFPAGVDVTVGQCRRDRPLAPEWCAASPALTAVTDATGAFTGQLTISRAVTLGSGAVADCVGEGCVVAAAPGDGSSWATADISLVRRTILAAAFGPTTVTPQGTVDISGAVLCTPTGGGVDVSGVITQTVDDRTITATFTATTTCSIFNPWRAHVVGTRTQRFKTGPASITTWANEAIDPFPDDSSAVSVEVQLVRPD
jgi:hypothetical protein